MMQSIQGHFDGNVFVPDDPVDLPAGARVVIHVEQTDTAIPPQLFDDLDDGTLDLPSYMTLDRDRDL